MKEDEKAQMWREHFRGVLNGRQPSELYTFEEYMGDDILVDNGKGASVEAGGVIKKLKNTNSPREDLITAEMLKATLMVKGSRKCTTY